MMMLLHKQQQQQQTTKYKPKYLCDREKIRN